MKSIDQWLAEYGESHTNKTNKTIHWICVPTIFFCMVGFFYGVKVPVTFGGIQINVAIILMLLLMIYYFSLSKTLSIGMLLFVSFCLWLCSIIEHSNIISLWQLCLIAFTLAWIGQFYGHKVEGKKPSFFKDIQFLLIGPAWLMSFVYKKLGIAL